MSKYVSDKNAAKSISAYVILNKRGDYVAKVQVFFGSSTLVNVFQLDKAAERSAAAMAKAGRNLPKDGLTFQHGSASGSGYDKETAALSGMWIDGHALTDHCNKLGAPKPPKGCTLYPRDFKPKAGYSLANYGSRSRSTGRDMRSHDWKVKAIDELGEAAHWDDIAAHMAELESAWAKTADAEYGYSDCYRMSGLKYLEAIGYRVIQAI